MVFVRKTGVEKRGAFASFMIESCAAPRREQDFGKSFLILRDGLLLWSFRQKMLRSQKQNTKAKKVTTVSRMERGVDTGLAGIL